MTSLHLSLTVIFFAGLYIAWLQLLLHIEKQKNRLPDILSSDTEKLFLVQDKCFKSPHEAIAIINNNGTLILANDLFKEKFPGPRQQDSTPVIYDFFPEKMWFMLQEGLSQSKLQNKKINNEFSINEKHFLFTFSPANEETGDHSLIVLFCKELSSPAMPHHCVSADDATWKSILKLTNPVSLHSDWYNCFKAILPELCESFGADELFLLDNNPTGRTPLLPPGKDRAEIFSHNWILSIPVWMNLLKKGNTIQNSTDNFDPEEKEILKKQGIQTLLLIPLIVNDELLGVIGLSKFNNSSLFSRVQINSLRFIANILAMAISNQHDRSERDRLATVVEQSSDCIIIINVNGSILYANPACKQVTGFLPEEIIGRSIKRLYTHSIRKKVWHQLKNALEQGETWSGQFENYRKNRTLYKEEMLLYPVYDHEGNVANQVIIKRDITEDKRLESIAEAANLMDNIGFIFSSIRHELGNPTNSIKVSLSVLESNIDKYDTEAITRFIHRSLSDIRRVEYLLKTLKNFSIFERPDVKATDMSALLEKLIQLTEKDLAKQYVMLAIIYPPNPLIGMIDPRAFLQVLLNLITNAVAALDKTDNKKITISLRQKKQSQLTFTLEDNGCGMEEETVNNLFRPFFTTKPEGTGLGLVIVKKMLSKMNCSITATSRKGKGTRMEIIIPTA